MIVTGIFDLERYERRGRSTRSYIANSWILPAPVPMVIFAEEEFRPEIAALRPTGVITLWGNPGPLPTPLPTEEAIRRCRFRFNPLKDTPRYLGLMRNKLLWLKRGAEMARGPVTWVDIGIVGELPATPDVLLRGAANRIKIGELSHVPRSVRHDRGLYYADHYWPVGASVIRGSPDVLSWLDARVEEEWQWCLANGFAATDEMMIGYVLLQHPERFDVYYADHPTLVTNFDRVRGSRELIFRMALRALDDGFEEAAVQRFTALANS